MNTILKICLLINGLFFAFGFFIITQSATNIDVIDVNGTNIELKFNLNNLIASIVAFIIVIALIGINVLGSGLQSSSVEIITTILKYLFLWSVISIFSSELFVIIPGGVGSTIYVFLTILFGIGILIEEVSKSNGGD